MMSEQAHDMSRYWRIFTYQHGRISGTFVVKAGKDGVHNVCPLEVTVYADEAHTWGRVLYSRDLTAFLKNGEIDIPKHMISEAVRYDVEDAWGDMVVAITECIAAWPQSTDSPLCRWCSEPIEECLPGEPGTWVHSGSGMSLCWRAPDGKSAEPPAREQS